MTGTDKGGDIPSRSADEILRITDPFVLFHPESLREDYGRLAKRWHPDRHGNSVESNRVMSHINALYQQALAMVQSGIWVASGSLSLLATDRRRHCFRFRVSRSFELGTMYIGDGMVLYLVAAAHRDLFENAVKVVSGFRYAGEAMRREVQRYLPEIMATFETADGRLGMVVRKTPDLLLLRDVLRHYGGRLPDRHAAWILSSLHNLACYLDYAGLSHNAISLDTYFISPPLHNGALLGGWWYAVPQGERLLAVPADVYAVLPPKVRREKVGSILTDLELIRRVGRELLGDPDGSRLADMGAAPKPMIEWLRGAPLANAVEDYAAWCRVLTASFGPRKFVKMDLTPDLLYGIGN